MIHNRLNNMKKTDNILAAIDENDIDYLSNVEFDVDCRIAESDNDTFFLYAISIPNFMYLDFFLEKNPDIPTLIANLRVAQLSSFLPLFKARENLFMDTSGFMAGLFPVDTAWPQGGDRLVFGTNAPMTEMYAIRHILDTAAVDSSAKDTILTGTSFLNYFN